MGWASGSYLAEEIWEMFKNYIPEGKKVELAKKLFDLFEDRDADDWSDCELVRLARPDYFDEVD